MFEIVFSFNVIRTIIYVHVYIILDFLGICRNVSVHCQSECTRLHKTVNMVVLFVTNTENTYPKGRALMQMYRVVPKTKRENSQQQYMYYNLNSSLNLYNNMIKTLSSHRSLYYMYQGIFTNHSVHRISLFWIMSNCTSCFQWTKELQVWMVQYILTCWQVYAGKCHTFNLALS